MSTRFLVALGMTGASGETRGSLGTGGFREFGVSTVAAERTSVGGVLDQLLHTAVCCDASDIHLVAGVPPAIRRHGRLCSVGAVAVESALLEEEIRSIVPDGAGGRSDDFDNLDFALQRDMGDGSHRFRVNVFRARGSLGCTLRVIPEVIPSLDWAGFPEAVLDRITEFRNGLVLFTGITGSGKSTSMAMLIERMNELGGRRIITLEDPIEYVFQPRPDSIITQREVGADVRSFADGLRFGLRQDPDVILVGEIRDRDTARLAITAAETGHLVLTTMHTRDAKGAITRLTDMVSPESQADLRTQLALSLQCVISQHLLPPASGERRVLALEVMFDSLAVKSAIRSGKVETLGDAIRSGKAEGMISLDQWLTQLLEGRVITLKTAWRFANSPQRLG